MRPRKLRPSPATTIAVAALFVALGGVGVAATGGNFILGQSNTADATTELGSAVGTGPTLELSNSGNKPAARFNAVPGVPPFVVNSQTRVGNLNADKLDNLSSESFTQGGGRLYSAHRENVAAETNGTLLDIPGVMSLPYHCGQVTQTTTDVTTLSIFPDHLYGVLDGVQGTTVPVYFGPDQGSYGLGAVDDPTFVHMFGSRPFNRMTFQPAVFVDARIALSFNRSTNKCVFQAVAAVFG